MIIKGTDGKKYECYLGDDGTLDTVIIVNGHEFRFDAEYAAYFRNSHGAMTKKGFKELCHECIDDLWQYEEV
jgi:hypothetical protein